MNELDYLKIVGSQLVLTGYRDKHNQLVDKVIYDIKIEDAGNGLSRLSFYLNNKTTHIDIPTSLASMKDVSFDTLVDGQTIIYNTTQGKWINSTPALSTLSDVALSTPKSKDVLLFEDGKWVNGVSENNTYGSTVFVSTGDAYTDAISTLDSVLALLAPAKPSDLRNISLSIPSSYSAIQTKTGITQAVVTDDTTPSLSFTGGAFDATTGTLSAELIADNAGVKAKSTTTSIQFTATSDKDKLASDTNNNIRLTITDDYDFHNGVVGKSGFWMAFLAKVDVLNALTAYPTEEHVVSMTHSKTGTSTLKLFVDNPATPSVTNGKVAIKTGTGSKRISGVPTLELGNVIKADFTVNNAIKTFYRPTIASASSTVTNTVSIIESGIKTYDAAYNATADLTIATNQHTEDLSAALVGYNSKGVSATANVTIASTQVGKKMRVDTKSVESKRRLSGDGELPTTGFGGVYDSTKNLATEYLHELQLIGGVYQYPSGDYTTNFPISGPNYNGLTGYRYATFMLDLTNSAGVQNITVAFTGTTGFNNKVLADFKLQVRVVNDTTPAQGTAGWVDGNAAYGAVINPNANNDPALVMISTTNTTKVVTFGQSTKKGICYVRIGMTNSSGYKFSDVTITAS
jgi:hypothetical protein